MQRTDMRIRFGTMIGGAAALLVLAAGLHARACFMWSPQPVQVWLDHIHVDVVDQVAVKTYNCTFLNPNPQVIAGATCYMELEPGAQVDDMSVLVDGKEMHAEILDVDKANQVFTDIVRQGGSPALLEYYGNQLVQTRIPRIPARGTVTVKLQYTTVLKKQGGLVRLQMLNTNPKALLQPLKSAGVTVNIKSTQPIKNVYSPTHPIALVEKPDWDVAVEWSQENYLPKHPFILYYQVDDAEVGASLLTFREPGQQGTFMLMLSPTIGQGAGQITDAHILPKDVVFCVDTSGSMLEGNKMTQAQAALRHCLESLRPQDRFNVVDFSTVPRQFSESGLVEARADSVSDAVNYAGKLRARGGTAIEEALSLSLDQLGPSDRMKMIVFATDGLPTIGERDADAILKLIDRKNTGDARIFVFGEGYDVNTRLLDFLALGHRGEADYILPDEDIQQRISRFFDRVGSPVMTDLEVSVQGLSVDDVYPRKIPDIFKGEQVIVYGRYTGHGTHQVELTGTLAGQRTTFRYELEFPEVADDDKNAFVPRLWAGQKIDFLINEIRRSGTSDKELVEEVARLAKRYGIVTPYTSFLMAEDIVTQPLHAYTPRLLAGVRSEREASDQAAPTEAIVRDAAGQAKARQNAGRGALFGLAEQAGEALRREGRGEESLAVIRHIGSRTFYQKDSEWYDSLYEPARDERTIEEIPIGSKRYFDILAGDSRAAKFLALGNVTVELGGRWYRFVKG